MIQEVAILAFCRSAISRLTGADAQAIAPDASFAELGLDSASAIYLVLELEEEYGIELYPTVTADHPTVALLVRHVASLAG